MSRILALITAAGSGSRFSAGADKLLLPLEGVPVLIRTLLAFENNSIIGGIGMAVRSDKIPLLRSLCASWKIGKVLFIVPGGRTRQESIGNMLSETGGQWDYAAVHDGARPLISKADIKNVIDRAMEEPYGAVLGRMPSDTIKIVGTDGRIEKTLPRCRLTAVQTPQVFPLAVIRRAYEEACRENFTGTDDSSLVERFLGKPALVESLRPNPKITGAEDLILCKNLLRGQKETGYGRK